MPLTVQEARDLRNSVVGAQQKARNNWAASKFDEAMAAVDLAIENTARAGYTYFTYTFRGFGTSDERKQDVLRGRVWDALRARGFECRRVEAESDSVYLRLHVGW